MLRRDKWAFWAFPAGLGMLIHGGTALVRLAGIRSYPLSLDFAGYYVGAHCLRSGISPYPSPQWFTQSVCQEWSAPAGAAPLVSPPAWAWLLSPLSHLPFPSAAAVWFAVSCALLTWSALKLSRLTGAHTGLQKMGVWLAAVTFGPVVLDLMLGQNSLLLLAAAIATGETLRLGRLEIRSGVMLGLSAVGKVFPAAWLAVPLLLSRWKLAATSILLAGALAGIVSVRYPGPSRDYWRRFLPSVGKATAVQGDLDDQSLVAWMQRLGRSQSYTVAGLSVQNRSDVHWEVPWYLSPTAIYRAGAVASTALVCFAFLLVFRFGRGRPELAFYLWVMVVLLVVPHMMRYNHTLLLLAAAWLWGAGGHGKTFAAFSYLFAGLSRLNHLWALLLPAPWGPLASGCGAIAVLIACAGLAVGLSGRLEIPPRAVPEG
jgi:hypothetical protein